MFMENFSLNFHKIEAQEKFLSELRGITDVYPVPFGPYQGNNFFLLYMYSNDTGTEEFNLKFYDESSGLTCNIEETYLFIADDPQGTLVAPVFITLSDDAPVDVLGCTDDVACNFDVEATSDDGSCTYPSGCDNVCGSTLENDECGVCGGDFSD